MAKKKLPETDIVPVQPVVGAILSSVPTDTVSVKSEEPHPILAEPKDNDTLDNPFVNPPVAEPDAVRYNLGRYVANFVNQNERPGSSLPDIMNDIAYDEKFQALLKAAR